MIRSLFCGLFILSISSAAAQISPMSGVRQHALGNSGANIHDVWSAKNNPGAFAFMEESQASVTYQNRFLISELMTQGLAYGHHSKKGNFGVFIQHSGFNLFRTIQFGGTYALALSPRLGMGVNFNYQQIRFGDIYGSKHHFSGSLGINYKLTDNFSIGASAQNINRSKVSDFQNERLPTTMVMGVLYHISSKVSWMLDVEKEITSQLNVKTGLEMKAHDYFEVRLGINSYPFQSSFGFGVHFKKIDIDIAAIWHSQIGLTPSLGLVYKF